LNNLNTDQKISNSLDSTALINVNSLSNDIFSDQELNSKINIFENYNNLKSRFFTSTFYFDNKILNFTNIFLKTDKSACLDTVIKNSLTKTDLKNLKPKSFFDSNKITSTDVTSNFSNREFFSHNKFIGSYTQLQIVNNFKEDFLKNIFRTNLKFDEYVDKNIKELINQFSFFSYVFQTIENNKSSIETNTINFLEINTDNTRSQSSDFVDRLSNKAYFINFNKRINIHQNTNVLNLKNLKWNEDEVISSFSNSLGNDPLIFTIENNYQDSYKMLSEYVFEDNINELKVEFSKDERFLNILNNIYFKIKILRNYRNDHSIYSLQFDYKIESIIESLPYNEYFFIEIKVNNEQVINKYYNQMTMYPDIVSYLEKSAESIKKKIKIKIILERFKYKSFHYYNKEANKLTYYYSLENIFQPVFFSSNKLKIIIQKFFEIQGEIDHPTEIKNDNKFQFSYVNIEEVSPKFISICFYEVKNYNYNDYEINVLPAISGVIFKDNTRISNIELIPFYKYKSEYFTPITSTCNEDELFLYFKTNYRYLENPNIKDLKFSVYENYISFFINPACYNKIKSMFFYNNQPQDVIQLYKQMRSYIILDSETINRINLDIEFLEIPKKSMKVNIDYLYFLF
jgi:hypothetical protein